jgi:hypothetical protein
MKHTRIYICGKVNGVISLKKTDATLLTSFDGLYEVSSVVEKVYNEETYYVKRVVDNFSKSGVLRDVYLVEN